MIRYVVVIPPAIRNLILTRVMQIAMDSLDNALAWESRLITAINSIGDAPAGYAIDPDASAEQDTLVRKYVFERTYLVFFEIDEPKQTVIVTHFRHGAQMPPGDAV